MAHAYSSFVVRASWRLALGLGATLLVASAAQAQKYEAENPANALAGSGIVVDNTISGFTGNGYVNFNGNAPANSLKLTIPVTVTTAGAYSLVVRYESQFGTTANNNAKIGAYSVNNGAFNKLYLNGTAPGIPGANFKSTAPIQINLNAGANTIVIADNGYGYFGVDYITLASASAVTALTPSAAGRVEAEAGQVAYAQSLVRDDDASPYSGTGYITSFAEATPSPSTITLPISIATAGLYQVAVGAREQFESKSFDVTINNGTRTSTKFNTALGATPSATFQSFIVGKFNLTAGTNTITITSATSYIDIDYVDVTATTGVATAVRAGAEAQKSLSAYPNPTAGQALTVRLELAAAQETTFDLVNTLGQRVSTTTRSLHAGTNVLELPTTGVGIGLYQLVARCADQPLLVQRVLIN